MMSVLHGFQADALTIWRDILKRHMHRITKAPIERGDLRTLYLFSEIMLERNLP